MPSVNDVPFSPPPSYDGHGDSDSSTPSFEAPHASTTRSEQPGSSSPLTTRSLEQPAFTLVTTSTARQPVVDNGVQPYDPYAPANILAMPRTLDPEFDRPPEYFVVQVPTRPIVYTFSPISADSMLLIPSAESPDSRPKYRISVRMNCFIPSSFITSVRAGSSEDGELIGDFEMGISDKPATLCIRGKEFSITDVLKKNGSRKLGTWEWRFVRKGLFWDCMSDTVKKCFSKDKQTLYATFKPVTVMRLPNTPAPLQELEVMPPGSDYFDDIILSLLIIERWRLSPVTSDFKPLFNAKFNL